MNDETPTPSTTIPKLDTIASYMKLDAESPSSADLEDLEPSFHTIRRECPSPERRVPRRPNTLYYERALAHLLAAYRQAELCYTPRMRGSFLIDHVNITMRDLRQFMKNRTYVRQKWEFHKIDVDVELKKLMLILEDKDMKKKKEENHFSL